MIKKLTRIQVELKAPKNQFNKFGGYNYRSAEDILEGIKPLLDKYKVALVLNDELVHIGENYYVKATATLYDNDTEKSISTTAYARESENRKGMDHAQVTGATSSYARKYAMNGLLAIDDTKDSDFTNKHNKEEKATAGQLTEMNKLGVDIAKVSGKMGVKALKDLTKEQAQFIIDANKKALGVK